MDITKLAILYSKWVPKEGPTQDGILGEWPEDDHPYTLEVPYQLRDEIIQLQNALVDKANEARELQNTIDNAKKKLKAMFDSLTNMSDFEPIPIPSVEEEEYGSISSTIPNIGGVIVDSLTSI
jgi:hypothetical protein